MFLTVPTISMPSFSFSLPRLPRQLKLSDAAKKRIERIYLVAKECIIIVAHYAIKAAKVLAFITLGGYFAWKFTTFFCIGLLCGVFVPASDDVVERVNNLWESSNKVWKFSYLIFSAITLTTTLPSNAIYFSLYLGHKIAHHIIDRRDPLPLAPQPQ
jgi:hypothetical protein